MRESLRSLIASNRGIVFLIGLVLSVAVLGFAGWGDIRQAGDVIAGMFSDDSAQRESTSSRPKKRDNPAARSDWFMHPRRYP
ncbi:MAG TPA: hypothetical protein VNA17_10015, partial [Pyrinomonadaceae bacterium]|nr:hypothetical protein [Pyrinomonadaceae bacterium]